MGSKLCEPVKDGSSKIKLNQLYFLAPIIPNIVILLNKI